MMTAAAGRSGATHRPLSTSSDTVEAGTRPDGRPRDVAATAPGASTQGAYAPTAHGRVRRSYRVRAGTTLTGTGQYTVHVAPFTAPPAARPPATRRRLRGIEDGAPDTRPSRTRLASHADKPGVTCASLAPCAPPPRPQPAVHLEDIARRVASSGRGPIPSAPTGENRPRAPASHGMPPPAPSPHPPTSPIARPQPDALPPMASFERRSTRSASNLVATAPWGDWRNSPLATCLTNQLAADFGVDEDTPTILAEVRRQFCTMWDMHQAADSCPPVVLNMAMKVAGELGLRTSRTSARRERDRQVPRPDMGWGRTSRPVAEGACHPAQPRPASRSRSPVRPVPASHPAAMAGERGGPTAMEVDGADTCAPSGSGGCALQAQPREAHMTQVGVSQLRTGAGPRPRQVDGPGPSRTVTDASTAPADDYGPHLPMPPDVPRPGTPTAAASGVSAVSRHDRPGVPDVSLRPAVPPAPGGRRGQDTPAPPGSAKRLRQADGTATAAVTRRPTPPSPPPARVAPPPPPPSHRVTTPTAAASAYEDDERATSLSSPLAAAVLYILTDKFPPDVIRVGIVAASARKPVWWARHASDVAVAPGAARDVALLATKLQQANNAYHGRTRGSSTAAGGVPGPSPNPDPTAPAGRGASQSAPSTARRLQDDLPARGGRE